MKNWLDFWKRHLYIALIVLSVMGLSIYGGIVLFSKGADYLSSTALVGVAINDINEEFCSDSGELIDLEAARADIGNSDDKSSFEDKALNEDMPMLSESENMDLEAKNEKSENSSMDDAMDDAIDDSDKDKDEADSDEEEKISEEDASLSENEVSKESQDEQLQAAGIDPSQFALVNIDNTGAYSGLAFIGDSRQQGFCIYSQLDGITCFANKGFQIHTATTKPVFDLGDGRRLTLAEALMVTRGYYSKVYIMFGLNELNMADDKFASYYYNLVDYVKLTQPNAQIYLESVIHVSKQKSDTSAFTNDKINQRNELIKIIAATENVHYLDLNEVFTDEEGALFADAASDGIHLKSQYVLVWRDYLLTHSM